MRLDGWYEVVGRRADEGLFSSSEWISLRRSDEEVSQVLPRDQRRFVAVAARDGSRSVPVRDQVEQSPRRKRHAPYMGKRFRDHPPDFLSSLWNQLTGAMVLLTGIISGVGLLVGGIGVMNIMLISVTERTAEIGVRKAVGARKADIRVQFLLEAIMLSCIGGVIGILVGALIALAVRTALPAIPAFVSPLWIVLGFTISVSVGLFFGYYPANRAANLDPIVCLRYE